MVSLARLRGFRWETLGIEMGSNRNLCAWRELTMRELHGGLSTPKLAV